MPICPGCGGIDWRTIKFNERVAEVQEEIRQVKQDIDAAKIPDPRTIPAGEELRAELDALQTRARDLSNTFTQLLPPVPVGGGLYVQAPVPLLSNPHQLGPGDEAELEEYSRYAKQLRDDFQRWQDKLDASRALDENVKYVRGLLDKAKDAVKGALGRVGGGGAVSPGGGGGGSPRTPGPGSGLPSVPGQFGGRFGGLGNRSGRGPGGSQYLPGLGFFPGAGPGAGGGVGHGIGGFGPGMGDSDGPPGPWGTAGGLGSFKKGHSGTGRQPGGGTAGRRGSGGYSETSKDRSDRGGGGGDVDRDKPTTGGGGGGGTIDKAGERAPAGGLSWGSLLHDDDKSGGTPKDALPGGDTPAACASSNKLSTKQPGDSVLDAPNTDDACPADPEQSSDPYGDGGAEEGPRVKRGGPYFVPRGGGMRAGRRSVSVASTGLTYLDFLHKGVDPGGDGWGGNNPVVTPAIKPSDLFKPADDSTGPYNPKGTDYRPAPDDPSPGGPAGAAGRVATRVRVRQG